MSQSVPFVVPGPAPEPWFSDPLPTHMWTGQPFCYLNDPGPGFAHWLAQNGPSWRRCPSGHNTRAQHERLANSEPFGAPLIAKRAQPPTATRVAR
jgi:hypothetical protein